MGRGIRRIGAALGAVVLTGVLAPALAQADSSAPSWNCRSSIAYVTTNLGIAQLSRIEPFAANGNPLDPSHPDRAACADDSQAVPTIGPFGTPIDVTADVIKGVTSIDPDTGPARAQTAYAGVKAADATVDIGSGAVQIKAHAVLSQASVHCVGNAPVFTSDSSIAGLSVNGQALPVQDGLVQITNAINGTPLSMLVKITIGNTLDGGDATTDTQGRIQQAAKIELLNLTGTPLATAVLGEAKVTRQGRTCDADNTPPPNPPSPNDPTTPTTPTTPTPPSIIYVPVNTGVTGSGTTVQLNGANGGCGHLKMYFQPNKKKLFGSTYGNRVLTRGTLVSCSGKPIVGGRIDVFHTIKGRTTRIRKTGVRSRDGGKITLILPMNLTTRTIAFEYRGNLASSKVTARQTLSLVVRYKGKVITKEPGPKRTSPF
ncbi:MAG: hypothetical protein JWO02_2539 [Solirubrobacterales bacterium]|nr:hypothetical protein [Solirubrobacterales bacterium]